jgi:hypothetical protein
MKLVWCGHSHKDARTAGDCARRLAIRCGGLRAGWQSFPVEQEITRTTHLRSHGFVGIAIDTLGGER